MSFPYKVDASHQFNCGSEPATSGPYPTNSTTRYAVLQGGSGITPLVGVWKSTDNGATWSHVDFGGDLNADLYSSCFDGSRYIWVFYNDPLTGKLDVNSFDTSTDTWGMPAWTGYQTQGIGNAFGKLIACIYRIFDGKIVVLTNSNGSITSGGDLIFINEFFIFDPIAITYSSRAQMGFFDYSTHVGATIVNSLLQLCEGDGGLLHVLTFEGSGTALGNGDPLLLQSIRVDNVVGTVVLKIAVQAGTDGSPFYAMVYDATSGYLKIAYSAYSADISQTDPIVRDTIQVIQGLSILNVIFGSLFVISTPGGLDIDQFGLAFAINGTDTDLFIQLINNTSGDDFWLLPQINGTPAFIGNTTTWSGVPAGAVLFSAIANNYGLLWSSNYWEIVSTPTGNWKVHEA